jgi:Ran GTPase-activating protein (RanGAP) involved in mRNA processing and transport
MDEAATEHRLTLHGSEDPSVLKQRLLDAVEDERIVEIELVDIEWKTIGDAGDHLLTDEIRQVLSRQTLEKIVLRGEQHGRLPLDLLPVMAICLHQVRCTPFCGIQFDHKRLKELSLTSMTLNGEIFPSLVKLLSHRETVLEKLDLSDSRFMRPGFELQMAFQFNQSLKWLSLSECNLQDSELRCILTGLRSHNSISCLDISFNKCGLESQAIPYLRRMLQNTHTLTSLNVGFCAFGSGRQVNLSTIFHCLSNPYVSPKSLKILQIGGNNLRDKNMYDVATMLVQNGCLEQLDLSSNRFTDEGIQLLAENLGRMKRLRVLDLEGNDLSVKGVRHLRDNICSNKTIVAIEIDEALSNTQDGRCLALHLDLNWGGQRILVEKQQHASFPLSLLPSILARANNWDKDKESFEREPSSADVILHFVKKGPLFSHVTSAHQ